MRMGKAVAGCSEAVRRLPLLTQAPCWVEESANRRFRYQMQAIETMGTAQNPSDRPAPWSGQFGQFLSPTGKMRLSANRSPRNSAIDLRQGPTRWQASQTHPLKHRPPRQRGGYADIVVSLLQLARALRLRYHVRCGFRPFRWQYRQHPPECPFRQTMTGRRCQR